MLELRLSRGAIITIVFALIGVWGLLNLWPVILLVLVALIFMIGLLPYVEALVNRGLPRVAAVLVVLAIILAVIAGLFALVVPTMIDQFGNIQNDLPESAREWKKSWPTSGST